MKISTDRTKLIVFISALLLAGFFLTNFISYLSAKDSLRNSIINTSLPLTRDNIYSEIQRDLMRPIFISSLMANDTFLKDWAINGEGDVSEVKKYLGHILNEYGFFSSFFVSERTHNYYYSNGILKTVSPYDPRDAWYYAFTSKHEQYELNVDANQAEQNKMTIFINHRVYDYDNKLLGVTGVGLDLDRIVNLLSEYQVKYDREIYLVDLNGNMQVHSDNVSIHETNIRNSQGIDKLADKILVASLTSSNYEYDNDKYHVLLTARYIPELNWVLIVGQNQNAAMQGIWYNFLKNSFLGFAISLVIILIIAFIINSYQRKLELLACTDHLTGTLNRREFSRVFKNAVERYDGVDGSFSVILFDIDNFKHINDTYGHLSGDKIISIISDISKSCVRSSDRLARWGGDEFIILVHGGVETAETIAKRIMAQSIGDKSIKMVIPEAVITLSVGIAVYRRDDTENSLTSRADAAMYSAKQKGRNRIETA